MPTYVRSFSSPQIPPVATGSAAGTVVPGQLLPDEEILHQLREKFLSVWDVASILESKTLPWYCIHRDFWKIGDSRAPPGPIPGNDYHATDARITADPAAWAGRLRFDPSHRRASAGAQDAGALIVPFKHTKDHEARAEGDLSLKEAAALIRELWPEAEIGPPVYRFNATRLTDPNAPEYRIFHWILSKKLNSEIVAVQSFSHMANGHFLNTQKLEAHMTAKEAGDERFEMPAPLSEVRLHGDPFSSAQFWSFTQQDSTISFPSIASILCLLTNPSKQSGVEPEFESHKSVDRFADRDITWCLDSLHGFCRRQTPQQPEVERSLSFTLGTSPDFWMYFHFVFHFFVCHQDGIPIDTEVSAHSGMQLDRGRLTVGVELGRRKRDMVFAEQRTWIGVRVATRYHRKIPDASPSAVGVVVSDYGRTRIDASGKDWEERDLQSPTQAPGVALFQMALLQHLDVWQKAWNRTLDAVDGVFKIKLDCQDDVDQLDHLSGEGSCKTYTRLIMVLLGFRNHIDTVAESVRGMYDEWARTYPGNYTERRERFDIGTQHVLLSNWKKVLAHMDILTSGLEARIQKSIDELRIIREGTRF